MQLTPSSRLLLEKQMVDSALHVTPKLYYFIHNMSPLGFNMTQKDGIHTITLFSYNEPIVTLHSNVYLCPPCDIVLSHAPIMLLIALYFEALM